jgi:hypothetical protein
MDSDSTELDKFRAKLRDREYQIWQRNPLPTELYSRKVIEQKLDYIHQNPVSGKWKLAKTVMDYHYSSIWFYDEDDITLSFLTHYMEDI